MEIIINDCNYDVKFDEDNCVVLYVLRLLQLADLPINKYYDVFVKHNDKEIKLQTGKQIVVKEKDYVKITIAEKVSKTLWQSKSLVIEDDKNEYM